MLGSLLAGELFKLNSTYLNRLGLFGVIILLLTNLLTHDIISHKNKENAGYIEFSWDITKIHEKIGNPKLLILIFHMISVIMN